LEGPLSQRWLALSTFARSTTRQPKQQNAAASYWDTRHQIELKKSSAGRKPFDAMLMFRMLVLQALNNLSDEQLEYQVRDRLSFSRFLGLAIEDSICRDRGQTQGSPLCVSVGMIQ
jgi:hypothetical protein